MDSWGSSTGVVRLSDGRLIRGTGTRRARGHAPAPDFAVYVLGRDPRITDWPNRWVRWRDFRVPDSTEDTIDALREAHARAASERVEIACGGGIGRTGAAIAVLAVMSGTPADSALDWVRANYHPHAVETRRQRSWITAIAPTLI